MVFVSKQNTVERRLSKLEDTYSSSKTKTKNKINRKKEYKKNTRRATKAVFETTVIEFLQITV